MARRISLSRRRRLGTPRTPLLLGLGARLAAAAVVLFPVCCLVAHWVGFSAERNERARRRIAASWAGRLMRDSTLTQYGWLPTTEASRAVDEGLAAHGAAYILLDSSRRVVRASERLLIRRAALVHLGPDGRADFPPLGRIEVTRAPLRILGRQQGVFLLLSSRPTAGVPLAREAGPEELRAEPELADFVVARIPDLSWQFLVVGAALSALGLWVVSHLLVARRLQGLTLVAAQRIDGRRPPRRFPAAGKDEIHHLATTLNTMQRAAHRLHSAMTQRENRRRDWLSELSHDLRTPLSALHLRLDNATKAKTAHQLRSMVATAIGDCERIQKLASGFMDLAELEVSEDFAFEPVMPEELVGQAMRGLRPIAQAAGVAVTTRVSRQPTILADGHRLLRALENILRNAIRHARQRVTVGVEGTADDVRFFVQDDGAGFPELPPGQPTNYVDWLGRRQAGGLGLRVADRIARAHGGRLVLLNGAAGTLVVCTVEAAVASRRSADGGPVSPVGSNGTISSARQRTEESTRGGRR